MNCGVHTAGGLAELTKTIIRQNFIGASGEVSFSKNGDRTGGAEIRQLNNDV